MKQAQAHDIRAGSRLAVLCAHNSARAPILLLFFVAVVALAGCDGGGGSAKQQSRRRARPIAVAVKTVEPGTVDIYATYPGRIRGAREVEVRSRIEGILVQRHYNEGAFVDQGQLLFTVNPELFKATVEQRKAQLEQAQANLNEAQDVWARVSKLYASNAVSEARRDQARAALEKARAAVHLQQANLETARIKLDYTSIEAPLRGVTSLEEVDVGALVTPGALLTTITQIDPAHVRFSIPAEDALMRNKALAALNKKQSAATQRKATLILPSGKVYEHPGRVDFTQSTINPQTGTVLLRAIFDNSDHGLVPGRFVRVRIRLETRHNTIVVPSSAITDSQTQTQVYVVTDDNKAQPVAVQLGPEVEGGRIIERGLAAGQQVIVIGLGQVRPGATVEIKPRAELAIDGQAAAAGKAAAPSAGANGKTAAKPGSGQTNPDQADSTAAASTGKQGE